MRPADLDALMAVAKQLDQLRISYAFTGGVVIGFLLDNPALVDIRTTDDVDAIAEVVTRVQHTDLEARLRGLGFTHDTSEGAPICRWLFGDTRVDVMPSIDTTGQTSDRWFAYALQTAGLRSFRQATVPTVSAACFIATKLVAFDDRGKGDYYSHDIEDIITIVDGRQSLIDEFTAETPSLRAFVGGRIRDLLAQSRFVEALPGHLGGDSASQARLPILRRRLDAIAALAQ